MHYSGYSLVVHFYTGNAGTACFYNPTQAQYEPDGGTCQTMGAANHSYSYLLCNRAFSLPDNISFVQIVQPLSKPVIWLMFFAG